MQMPPEIPLRNNATLARALNTRYVLPGPGDHEHQERADH